MTTEVQKGGLPTWTKILIGIVIVGFIGIAALFVGAIFFVKNLSDEAKDPVKIEQAAQKMADFGPVPEGYQRELGMDILATQIIVVRHPASQQTISLVSVAQKEKDPQAAIDKLIESGVETPHSSAKIKEIESRGNMEIAGTTMPYAVGKLADGQGREFEGMFGCLVSPTKNKTILVYAMQPLETKFDLATTERFLKTIKSF